MKPESQPGTVEGAAQVRRRGRHNGPPAVTRSGVRIVLSLSLSHAQPASLPLPNLLVKVKTHSLVGEWVRNLRLLVITLPARQNVARMCLSLCLCAWPWWRDSGYGSSDEQYSGIENTCQAEKSGCGSPNEGPKVLILCPSRASESTGHLPRF